MSLRRFPRSWVLSATALGAALGGCGKGGETGTADAGVADPCAWHVGPSLDAGACVIPGADAGLTRLKTPLVKLAQLVGDEDLEYSPPAPTENLTATRFGLTGTDRGSSFVHDGRLYFFFGDTNPTLEACDSARPFNADAIAVLDLPLTDAGIDPASLDAGLPLTFLTAADGKWLPVTLDSKPLLRLNLPLVGFSSGADIYAFFSAPGYGSAVLGVAHDDGTAASLAAYTSLATVTANTARMLNVFPVQMPASSVAGLGTPWSGDTLLVWGRPADRDAGDPIYLAAAPFDHVADTSAWRFYAGGPPGAPTWSPGDENAQPVYVPDTAAGCNGSFSVTYLPGLDRWLLLDRCDGPLFAGPRRLLYRVAPSPVGPWSDERIFFDPATDRGYGRFMHVPGCDSDFTPPLVDPESGRSYWGPIGGVGGSQAYPYAPFVVGPTVRYDGATRTVSFLLLVSVWNPYSPMVMRATITAADVGP